MAEILGEVSVFCRVSESSFWSRQLSSLAGELQPSGIEGGGGEGGLSRCVQIKNHSQTYVIKNQINSVHTPPLCPSCLWRSIFVVVTQTEHTSRVWRCHHRAGRKHRSWLCPIQSSFNHQLQTHSLELWQIHPFRFWKPSNTPSTFCSHCPSFFKSQGEPKTGLHTWTLEETLCLVLNNLYCHLYCVFICIK
jgi:hypothetical protein